MPKIAVFTSFWNVPGLSILIVILWDTANPLYEYVYWLLIFSVSISRVVRSTTAASPYKCSQFPFVTG